jgi:hypothetical protein
VRSGEARGVAFIAERGSTGAGARWPWPTSARGLPSGGGSG